jgi:hypothetical protein
MMDCLKHMSQKRTKWGIVTEDGRYVADPSGRTNLMAWTYDREKAEATASLQNGRIVDVEKFVKEFNQNPAGAAQPGDDKPEGK